MKADKTLVAEGDAAVTKPETDLDTSKDEFEALWRAAEMIEELDAEDCKVADLGKAREERKANAPAPASSSRIGCGARQLGAGLRPCNGQFHRGSSSTPTVRH